VPRVNRQETWQAGRQALTATLPEHRGMAGRESCRMQMRLQMQAMTLAPSYPVQIMIALAVAGG
jgi:hypothetical protein